MIDYDKWDEYYDGGFATDENIDRFWEEYDLKPSYEEFEYYGQKINVTVNQIMHPKMLQYIMGHSDISVTMNTYTHVKFQDAQEDFQKAINS